MGAAEEWISITEFAARRGVSRTAVQKAVKSGRVKTVRRSATGRLKSIEFCAATAEWNRNTDLDQAARNGKILGSPEIETQPVSEVSTSPDGGAGSGHDTGIAFSGKDPHGYYEARAGLARAQQQRAELDNLERQGTLVSAAEVSDEQFEIFRQLRDKLEQIPANLSERLAAETDPARAEHLLRTAIRNALNELSRRFAVDAIA